MGQFLHKYNTDNVHSRAVIVGFVNLLNSKIYFENVLSDTNIDIVYVPFFYSMTGDERFLQDYFLEWSDCLHPRHADGNYDVIPRGIVTLTSKNIDTAKMTHRFVRGNYVKEVNGELQTFSSYINSIPIAAQFDVEIETDTQLDAFKIEQAIIETFYKNQVFSVTYKGFRIPCQAGFAEDYGIDKTLEFSYQGNNKIKMKFTVAVETYFPVIDPTYVQSNSKRMIGFNTVEMYPEVYNKPRFEFTSPISYEKFFSGGKLPINWSNTGPIMRVNLYYRLAGSTTWIPIAKNLLNQGGFDWDIPFFNASGDEVINEGYRAYVITSIGRNAKVRAIIDGLGSVDQIVILDPGFGYDHIDNIGVELYPLPPVLPPAFVAPVIQATVVNGEVIGSNIVNPGSGFPPSPLIEIELKVEDANDETIYRELDSNISFVGDVDGSLPFPGNTYITNCVPTVTDLLAASPLVGQTVSGNGIVNGSVITSVNAALNRIEINNTTNQTVVGGEITLSTYIGKIYIQ